ncbi:MAG: hypothetical protein EPN91_07535 [Salinibacterium sp.]|nr:MAG: hypothetical protein EPN91_07535 [Salinibacterium sp.]
MSEVESNGALRPKRLTPKEKARLVAIDQERPITKDRVDHLRKQIHAMATNYPESRARVRSLLKAALAIADEILQEIEVLEHGQYDITMSPHERKHLVYKIKSHLKLEEPCPPSPSASSAP